MKWFLAVVLPTVVLWNLGWVAHAISQDKCPSIEQQIAAMIATAQEYHVEKYHGEAPPDPPDPPVDPPETPGDSGLLGGVPLTGWWGDPPWLARGNGGMGEKFFSRSGYGEMANNTNAALKLPGKGNPGWTKGWFEIDVYIDQDYWPSGGGQHLLGLMSQTAPQAGPYDPALPNLDGWLRLDLSIRYQALRLVIYQDSITRRTFTLADIPFHGLEEWDTIRVEWEQHSESVAFLVNGRALDATIAVGLNPIGNELVVGNMDTNRGSRCRGDHDPCGLTGRVRYRNLSYGQN